MYAEEARWRADSPIDMLGFFFFFGASLPDGEGAPSEPSASFRTATLR